VQSCKTLDHFLPSFAPEVLRSCGRVGHSYSEVPTPPDSSAGSHAREGGGVMRVLFRVSIEEFPRGSATFQYVSRAVLILGRNSSQPRLSDVSGFLTVAETG
jgi:hypothetical protein